MVGRIRLAMTSDAAGGMAMTSERDRNTISDEDITTTWRRGATGQTSAAHADPDSTDADGDDTDTTDSDSDSTDN